jgi:hypothetical protein
MIVILKKSPGYNDLLPLSAYPSPEKLLGIKQYDCHDTLREMK